MSLTFNVTKRDWKAAKRWWSNTSEADRAIFNGAFCPIAQAARRKIGRPLTNGYDINVGWIYTTIDGVRYFNDEVAQNIIEAFDDEEAEPVFPVTLTLEMEGA